MAQTSSFLQTKHFRVAYCFFIVAVFIARIKCPDKSNLVRKGFLLLAVLQEGQIKSMSTEA